MNQNDNRASDRLSQPSWDPSIYSMDSFDPAPSHEEFDPERSCKYGRESYGSRSSDSGSSDSSHANDYRESTAYQNEDVGKLYEEVETLKSKLEAEQASSGSISIHRPES